jgi:hypothetical protein
MRRIGYLLLIGLLILSFGACGSPGSNAAIQFNDDVLESMVRTAMNQPEGDILVSDALEVTQLDLRMDGNDWSSPRIHNLEALSHFANLTYLNLNWAVQSEESPFADVDISALGALAKLEALEMACVNVADISALGGMTNLKGLSAWGGSRLEDISVLASLTNLEAVDLRNNMIKDVTPLAGLANLNYIDVSGNLISDLSPLAGLENLAELYVADNLVADYTPLNDIMGNLGKRDFESVAAPQPIDFRDAVLEEKIRAQLDIPTGDITINDTQGVTELYLGNPWQEVIPEDTKISDITALKYFPNLFKLDIYDNNIEWIHSIRALPNLGILNVSGNKISDIFPLSGCDNLVLLYLGSCQVNTEGLVALTSLSKLESLDLSYSPNIGSVEALSGLTNLKALDLRDVRVDLAPLAGLTNLASLYLADPYEGKYAPDYKVLKDIYPNLVEKNFTMPEN